MNLDAIVQEAECRLKELDTEAARLRAVIAAARGVAASPAPAFPIPWQPQPTVNPPSVLPWPQPQAPFVWTVREVKVGDLLPAPGTICWGTTKIDNACAGGLGYYRNVGPGHYVVGMH